MGIVTDVTVQLYCDHPDHPRLGPPGVFTGCSIPDALRIANAGNWLANRQTGKVFCPEHRPYPKKREPYGPREVPRT